MNLILKRKIKLSYCAVFRLSTASMNFQKNKKIENILRSCTTKRRFVYAYIHHQKEEISKSDNNESCATRPYISFDKFFGPSKN